MGDTYHNDLHAIIFMKVLRFVKIHYEIVRIACYNNKRLLFHLCLANKKFLSKLFLSAAQSCGFMRKAGCWYAGKKKKRKSESSFKA